MKKLNTILKGIFLFSLFSSYLSPVFAQSPQKFNYQAVCRNGSGAIIANQAVTFRLNIHDLTGTGAILYEETQSATTNTFGLVNLQIGGGTPVSPYTDFAGIPWGTGEKFLQVEIDLGSGYTSLGAPQLLSVPYALYANQSGSGGATGPTGATGTDGTNGVAGPAGLTGATGTNGTNGTNGATGATGETGPLVAGTNGQTLRNNGASWVANSTLFNTGTNVGIGTTTPTEVLDIAGNVRSSGQFKSNIAVGTSPLNVNSTTLNTNLNADMVDGQHYSADWGLWTDNGTYLFPTNYNNYKISHNAGTGLLNITTAGTPAATNLINGTVNSRDAYNDGTNTYAYWGAGGNYGVSGSGNTYGIYGRNTSTPTVLGYLASSSCGAFGRYDTSHYGYLGTSNSGVSGYNTGTSTSYGVSGFNSGTGPGSAGVYGMNDAAAAGIPGVYGSNWTNTFGTAVTKDATANGITGLAGIGKPYHFGVFGTRSDDSYGPSAGVLGSVDYSSAAKPWGALGFQDSVLNEFAGYFSGKVGLKAGSYYTGIRTMAQSANINYTLPPSQGTGGTVLTNDGNGTLKWLGTNIATSQGMASTVLTSSTPYNNCDGASVTISVYGPGTIVVEANVCVLLGHLAAADDVLELAIATDTASGGNAWDMVVWTIPKEIPAFIVTPKKFTFTVRRVFTVSGAGNYTYYLTGRKESGILTDSFYSYQMIAEFK